MCWLGAATALEVGGTQTWDGLPYLPQTSFCAEAHGAPNPAHCHQQTVPPGGTPSAASEEQATSTAGTAHDEVLMLHHTALRWCKAGRRHVQNPMHVRGGRALLWLEIVLALNGACRPNFMPLHCMCGLGIAAATTS